jgi:TonB family protein
MSASTHVVVFSALGLVPPPSRVLAMHESQFEIIRPPPKVEPPAIKEPEPPPPEPVKAAPHRAAPEAAAPPPPTPSAAPPAEEVADFTGVTLTAEGGSSWSTAVGSGGALKGPVGKIGHGAAQGPQLAAKAGPIGPRTVALDSLARKPQAPPGLDVLLERNYPRRARLQGVEGEVRVSMRILPSGRIENIQVLQERPGGFDFAAACRETLRQAPPFVAPLDRTGAAVATNIEFHCTFEVGGY